VCIRVVHFFDVDMICSLKLTITLCRYDPSYHYFGICNAVCGSCSFALIVETVKVFFSRVPVYMSHC
jgi:hypothetical protein